MNQYLLPLIDELLNWLWPSQAIHLARPYKRIQIRIKEGDEEKTVFYTRYGYFKYQIMPFGLFNAPVSFQGYINKILAKKLNIFVIMYLDNIIIYTEDPG